MRSFRHFRYAVMGINDGIDFDRLFSLSSITLMLFKNISASASSDVSMSLSRATGSKITVSPALNALIAVDVAFRASRILYGLTLPIFGMSVYLVNSF